jgi:tRNA 5-methylaminomethyl-2-thiouridine biosynthesis bifunctional protein
MTSSPNFNGKRPRKAELRWSESGVPHSVRYNDTYFDREDGLAESRHVFINGCNLREEWRGAQTFVIGELGFGTSLNFVSAWDAWRQSSEAWQRLHYIAVEEAPLSPQEISRTLSVWPELREYADLLLTTYKNPRLGFQRLWFDQERICLTLLHGDVQDMLRECVASVDAWFLDGFAPDRNPEMWTQRVIETIASLSRPGASLATYTVSGIIRRRLANVGFDVRKRAGFGSKREVLAARLKTDASQQTRQDDRPWFSRPSVTKKSAARIAVVGAGIAGACVAAAFRRRNQSFTLVERNTEAGSETSATPSAILSPRLTANPSPDSTFYIHAWSYAVDLYSNSQIQSDNTVFRQVGTLVTTDPEHQEQHDQILAQEFLPEGSLKRLDALQASSVSGIKLDRGGLFFPEGGLIDLPVACRTLIDNAERVVDRWVRYVIRDGACWRLVDDDGAIITVADIVVIACGMGTSDFEQTLALPLIGRLGQLTRVSQTALSSGLQCALTGGATVTPTVDDGHWIGATFDHVSNFGAARHAKPTVDADRRNLESARRAFPAVFDDATALEGRSWVGVRCATPDHLPVAGQIPDFPVFSKTYADLRHGRHWETYPEAQYHDGLYVLSGLGARGAVSAPILAEMIASLALGEPLPVPKSVADTLHAGRFAIRNLIRGERAY